jgi:hypothetical protein
MRHVDLAAVLSSFPGSPAFSNHIGTPGNIYVVDNNGSWHNRLALALVGYVVVSLPVADTPNELRLARVRAYKQPSAE